MFLHIVGMAGAVDMGIVAGLGLILDMGGRNRDAGAFSSGALSICHKR
jgi:hypothetical protein